MRHLNLPPLCKSNTLLRTEGSMGSGGRAKIFVLGPASQPAAEVWSWELLLSKLTLRSSLLEINLSFLQAPYQKHVKENQPNRPFL